jgi:hypothetical protein
VKRADHLQPGDVPLTTCSVGDGRVRGAVREEHDFPPVTQRRHVPSQLLDGRGTVELGLDHDRSHLSAAVEVEAQIHTPGTLGCVAVQPLLGGDAEVAGRRDVEERGQRGTSGR